MESEPKKQPMFSSSERDYFYRLSHPAYSGIEYDVDKNAGNSAAAPPPATPKVVAEELEPIPDATAVATGVEIPDERSRAKRKSQLVSLAAALVCAVVIAGGAFYWLARMGGASGGSGAPESVDRASFAVSVGERVPAFKGFLLDPEGRGSSLSGVDLLGKEVVVLAWRSDQAASLDYLRSVNQVQSRFAAGDRNLAFLGISLDESEAAALEAVVSANAYQWPQLFDWDQRLSGSERPSVALGIVETPAIYVFDPLLRLRHKGVTPSGLAELLGRR